MQTNTLRRMSSAALVVCRRRRRGVVVCRAEWRSGWLPGYNSYPRISEGGGGNRRVTTQEPVTYQQSDRTHGIAVGRTSRIKPWERARARRRARIEREWGQAVQYNNCSTRAFS